VLEQHLLPAWPEIFRRIGEPEPRRNRARCPLHGGDSPYSLVVDEDRGLFFCNVCHAGGDKADFIQKVQGCGFKAALRWFWIEPGRPLAPNPAVNREREVLEAVRQWSRRTGRRLRREFRTRESVLTRAIDRLGRDPDDSWAWSWLAWSLPGLDRLEFLLDAIDQCRTDVERVRAWRVYRNEI